MDYSSKEKLIALFDLARWMNVDWTVKYGFEKVKLTYNIMTDEFELYSNNGVLYLPPSKLVYKSGSVADITDAAMDRGEILSIASD